MDVKELIRKSDMRDNETGRHYVCLSLREAERFVRFRQIKESCPFVLIMVVVVRHHVISRIIRSL